MPPQTALIQASPSHPSGRCADAFAASGSSPTVHIVGPGKVGRALLRLLPGTPLKLTGLSDSTATIHSAEGLDPEPLAQFKEAGASLSQRQEAAFVPLHVLLGMDVADFVVDCTASRPDGGEEALRRSLAVLSSRSRLVLAAKHALAEDPLAFASPSRIARLGFNAVLGGTGLDFKRDLEDLRARSRSVACVANATTTALIAALERGARLEAALAEARRDGVLESDPEQDLDGTDAGFKLVIVASLLTGRRRTLAEVQRTPFSRLDPNLLEWRYRRGLTTRLVGRLHPDGEMSLGYEELTRGSSLAVPASRVAYAYGLDDGRTRLHIGAGLGPEGTARALATDITALAAREVRP